MRVVAGTAKGRLLVAPPGQTTRPTPAKVRQAAFNSLESLDAVVDARIVDLFAGTGALAIEALSRGAASAVLCEPDRQARLCIERNLTTTGMSDRARVVPTPAEAWLATAPDRSIDLAVADPPYRYDRWAELLGAIAPVLADNALVVIESDREVEVGTSWDVLRTKSYGTTVVTIITATTAAPA